MSLTSYETIKPFTPMIREMIRTQRMPPWRADPTIGHFLGDRSLSSAQIKTLVHWVEAGAPRGTGADPLAVLLNGPSHGANYFSKKKLTIFWVGGFRGRRGYQGLRVRVRGSRPEGAGMRRWVEPRLLHRKPHA